MTDQRNFSDVRTARAHANGHGYTVSLDRFAFPGDPTNVHWLTPPPQGGVDTLTVVGVVLARYQVAKDGAPDWSAELELAAPQEPGGAVRVVSVTVNGTNLGSTGTTLPLQSLLAACLRVGSVTGHWQRSDSSNLHPVNQHLNFYTVKMGAPRRGTDGETLTPGDLQTLLGRRPRGYRQDADLLRRVWDAVCEHDRQRTERLARGLAVRNDPDFPTQRVFVAEQCHLPESSVQKQITAARRKYANTTQGDTK
jgi:hypothetical protein